MINGTSPLLIFTFPFQVPNIFVNIAGLKVIGEKLSSIGTSIGIPIPVYLASIATSTLGLDDDGIVIVSESRNIGLDTDVDSTPEEALVTQKNIDNVVVINMSARKDSILLGALLTLFDMCYDKAVAGKYTVSYFNGTTSVIGGKFRSISTNVLADSEKMDFTIELSKSRDKNLSLSGLLSATTGFTPL